MGLVAGGASVVGEDCEFERYELEFLRMPRLVRRASESQRAHLPRGRSGCEPPGECISGDCAVIAAASVALCRRWCVCAREEQQCGLMEVAACVGRGRD